MANEELLNVLDMMTNRPSYDKCTGISVLLRELNKEEFTIDAKSMGLLCNTVLKQLGNDVNDHVAGLAIKCLAPLVKMVSKKQIMNMTRWICRKFKYGGDRRCRIRSNALKTIISEVVSPYLLESVIFILESRMIGAIINAGTRSFVLKYEALEVLRHLLNKHGYSTELDHYLLLYGLVPLLKSNVPSGRKKTVSCIASLAPSLSDDLLEETTLEVVQNLRNDNARPEMTCTNIQMISALSRSVGYRFGRYVRDTVPFLLTCCTSELDNDQELCESCLLALGSFLLGCPNHITLYCDDILNLALGCLSYDPNFEEDDDDECAGEHADDDDYDSWKVRRAATKCLSAFIVSRPELLSKLYDEKACSKLINRFKEREEIVKMDVFSTFIDLVRQTGRSNTKGQVDMIEESPRWLLKQEVPKILKSVNRQLQEESAKTNVGAFSVLKELVVVLPDCLAEHIGSLIPEIEKALNDKSSTSSNLKIESLVFTRLALSSLSPLVLLPYIKALSCSVLSAAGERNYNVTAEALRVCGEIVRVVRPAVQGFGFDFTPYVDSIYNAARSRLTCQDQEVMECAISCMGLVISKFGDHIGGDLPACLQVLVDRMGNEITRLTAVKALSVIAASPLRVDLSCVLENATAELTAFLRMANWDLRQATLVTLNSLITAYGDQIGLLGSKAYEAIIVELSTLISDTDLHMTALTLELCCTLIADRSTNPNVSVAVRNEILPQALALVKNSLLRGQGLLALQNLFSTMVFSANTSFDTSLESLLSSAKPSLQLGGVAKHASYSIAQRVAVLCLAAGDQKCSSTVKMLTEIIQEDNSSDSDKQLLALLCLGEIGRRIDLSSHAQIESIIIESFQSQFEEIKSAASYALGNIAVGNVSKYLPFILDQIDNPQREQYLLLHCLKEVIVRQTIDKAEFQASSRVDKILKLLFDHCDSEEEGVRNVVAECLGKIALVEPSKLVPLLKVRTTCPSAYTRATVVTAVKYSVVERPAKIDEIIFPEISSFLMLIRDHDRHVRRAAVSVLSAFAQNKPSLIEGLVPELLPFLYDQTIVKQELIQRVELGPIKLNVDNGLELRKAAFECLDILLDNCLHQFNPSSFYDPCLKSGMEDGSEIQMRCHLMITKLADRCPSAVLSVLDLLVEPIQKTIIIHFGSDVCVIRNVLRTIAAVDRISGEDCSHKFKVLMIEISKSPALWDTYCSIRETVGV